MASGTHTPTPTDTLMLLAKCYHCIPPGMILETGIDLLGDFLVNRGGGCGTPSNTILIVGAGQATANQQYTHLGGTAWQGVTDPTWGIELIDEDYILSSIDFGNEYSSPASAFPCVWSVVENGVAPAPTGLYLPDLPAGFRYLLDENGMYVTDENGNYITVPP